MRRRKAAAVLLFCTGSALAFQLQPNNGCRQCRSISGGKIKLPTPIYASSFADDSDGTATAPSAAASAFDEMLEKFALPLEFKDISSSRNGGNVDAAVAGNDNVDGASDKTSSPSATSSDAKETTAPTDNNVATTTEPSSTSEIRVKKVDDKKEQADNDKVQSAGAEASVVQQVDDKKEQAAAPSKQEDAPPAFGPIVTPRRGFSDFGVTERAEPQIKWDFREETKMKPTALGVNPNRKTELVKMEEPTQQQQDSPAIKKEVDMSSVTESKAVSKTSGITAKDNTKSLATNEKSSVLTPTPSYTEIVPSSTAPDLIQTQPLTLPSINLPESLRNINIEDPGIIVGGVALFGAILYSALVQNTNRVDNTAEKVDEPKPNLIQKVKDAGVAGAISYAFWELGFWSISIPICVVGYNKFTGHWPDLSNSEDMKQLGGEIFAFVNVARLAVPLRIGLALSTVPWVDENIVQRFKKVNDDAQQQVEIEEAALQEQTFVEEGEFVEEGYYDYEEMNMSMEDEVYQEWSDDESQQGGEMAFGDEVNEDGWQQGEAYGDEGKQDFSQWSDFEQRLSSIEADAKRVASVLGPPQSEKANAERMANLPGNGYLNYIDEYCEPGTRSSNCAGAIKGYLDGLATTGAVASEREVTTIVGYLDSLSSNTTPNGTSRTGAAFVTYLDALSSGIAPSPPSAKAVAGYLDDLTATGSDGSVGTRVVDIEGRLSKLETSISSLPDDIASRIISWQNSQDKKMGEELEKIKKMLEDVKS
ncbi:hypothetical protein ACHAXM_010107 [Skeletonema potamos]